MAERRRSRERSRPSPAGAASARTRQTSSTIAMHLYMRTCISICVLYMYSDRGTFYRDMFPCKPSPGTTGSRCDFIALSVSDPPAQPWGSLHPTSQSTSLHPSILQPDRPAALPALPPLRRSAAFSTRTAPAYTAPAARHGPAPPASARSRPARPRPALPRPVRPRPGPPGSAPLGPVPAGPSATPGPGTQPGTSNRQREKGGEGENGEK